MSLDCVFCRILAGQAPASIVHRDPLCTAFLDNRPLNPGHLLVVPNRHADRLEDLPPDTVAAMARVAQRMAAAVRQSDLGCHAVNLLLSDGRAAGQEVQHAHLHVIPRQSGDGLGFRFCRGGGAPPDRATLDQIAERIRRASRE